MIAGDVEPEEVRKLAEETYRQGRAERRVERPAPAAGARPLRAGEGDARRRARRRTTVQRFYLAPSYASAKPGEAEALDLMMRIAATGSMSKIYKRMVIEDKQSGECRRLVFRFGPRFRPARLLCHRRREASPPRSSTRRSRTRSRSCTQNGVTQEELDRARASYIAEFVYTSDSQSRMARHYGWRLATGMSVADVEALARPAHARDRRRHPRGRRANILSTRIPSPAICCPLPNTPAALVKSRPMRQVKASRSRDGAEFPASAPLFGMVRGCR